MDGLMKNGYEDEYEPAPDGEDDAYDSDEMSDEDLLKQALECFSRAEDAEGDNRKAALDDIRFSRLSEQWPDEIQKKRQMDGRPCLTVNKLPAFIRQVVNDSRQNKPSIKIKPVDSGADVDTAEILSGLVRNIEYISNADVAYDTAVDSAVTGGFGYIRVALEYAHDDTFDMDIKIVPVPNVFSIYGDPNSQCADSSDWMEAFIVDDLTKDEFAKKYKGAEKVDWVSSGYTQLNESWYTENTVKVAEYWCRHEVERPIVLLSNGAVMDRDVYEMSMSAYDMLGIQQVDERVVKSWKVMQYIMTGAEVLERNEWPGVYIPIIPVYGDEVNEEGKRHFKSLIRDAKDAQRMFNYWRTTATELVALAPRVPFIGPINAFKTDAKKWATANTDNHPYLQYDGPVAPQRQPLDTGAAAGATMESRAASDDMKSILGLYDASLGQRSNETSGRAILARQREGDTSTFHFLDNMSRAIRHLGRVIIDLIPHIYTGRRTVRILGEDGVSKNVQLGKAEQSDQLQQVLPQTKPPMPGQTEPDMRIYDLTTGRYDVVVESGPSYNTRREEAATQMMNLIQANPQVAQIIGDLLAKNLDWPGADEIAKRLQAMLPEQIRQPDAAAETIKQQAQQAVQQLQGQIGQLQAELKKAEMSADAQKVDKMIDAKKLEIDAYNAETDRLKVTQASMTPQDVHMLVMQTLQQVLSTPDITPGTQQPQQPEIPPELMQQLMMAQQPTNPDQGVILNE